jgi:molecular chaperone Hsp33
MPDRIVTATASDGSFSLAAGITTDLVREARARHELSLTASAAVGRLLTGAALLGASLKGRERLSFQVVGSGPLRGLVAEVWLVDATTIAARGYARVPDAELPLNERGKFDVGRAVGNGRLQVTRSFEIGQPYQGVVALTTGEIGDDLAAYLAQSEQIPSVVALGVLADRSGVSAAGGIIAQVMPGASDSAIDELEARAALIVPVTTQIASGASVEDLLRSLSGNAPLRSIAEYVTRFDCRCTKERVETALLGLGRDELAKIARENQQTEAVCEFCKQRYVLSRDDVNGLIDQLEARST